MKYIRSEQRVRITTIAKQDNNRTNILICFRESEISGTKIEFAKIMAVLLREVISKVSDLEVSKDNTDYHFIEKPYTSLYFSDIVLEEKEALDVIIKAFKYISKAKFTANPYDGSQDILSKYESQIKAIAMEIVTDLKNNENYYYKKCE